MAVCVKHEAISTRAGSAGVTDPLKASDGHRVTTNSLSCYYNNYYSDDAHKQY